MDFSRTRFWVRLFGVPLTMRNTGNSEKMGALLRELQELAGYKGGRRSLFLYEGRA